MPRKDRMDAAGAAGLVAFALLLALNQVIIKLVNEGFQPVFFAGLRSALSVLCIYAWLRWRGIPVRTAPGSLGAGLLIGLIFSAEFLFLFLALDLTTVVRTSIIFYSMPVWLALMAHVGLPGERITTAKAIGLTMAFAGTAWAILDQGSSGGEASLLGDLCALAAAFGWAGTAFMARGSAMVRERPEMQLFWMVAVSGVVLLAVSPMFGPLIRDLTAMASGGAGISGRRRRLGRLHLLALAAFDLSGGISRELFVPDADLRSDTGWLVLGEPIGPGILGAAALVAAGIVLINRKPAARESRS